MKQFFIHLITAVSLTLALASAGLWASEGGVTIEVTDSSGNPVPDVVVSLVADKAMPISNALPEAVMAQRDRTFRPHVLAIPKGTVVQFPNEDDFRHHVYSFSKARPFEIRLYSGDEEKRIAFDTAGIVALGCNIHDSMLAYIYVTDTPYVTKTDENGLADFSSIQSGDYSVSLWHPLERTATGATPPRLEIITDTTIKKSFSIQLKRARKSSRKKRY